MLVALNENRELINLLEGIPKKQKFFCPACESTVRLKCGPVKIPHFAHVSLQSCQSWSENESEQHLALKKVIFAWAGSSNKVEIEKYLSELDQTPDLLIDDKIAIEVQCSRLSVKRLWERTLNYRAQGYVVFWLMGRDLWLGRTLSPLQKDLLYFSENRGFHYWELDLTRKVLRLKYLIHQNLRGQLLYLTEEFPFGQENFLSVLRKPFSKQKLHALPVKFDKNAQKFIQQELYYRVPYWMQLQEKYYRQGKNLLAQEFRVQWAPPGLDIFTGEVKSDFCQISRDLSTYYENFQKYHENSQSGLYSPAFYDKIKKC